MGFYAFSDRNISRFSIIYWPPCILSLTPQCPPPSPSCALFPKSALFFEHTVHDQWAHDVVEIQWLGCQITNIRVGNGSKAFCKLYRSRQYYDSKVLHNTIVTSFLTICSSLHTLILIQSLKDCRSYVHTTFYGPLGAKSDQLLTPESVFKVPLEILYDHFPLNLTKIPILREI